MTFLTKKIAILQGRTYHKLDSKEIKVQHKTRTSLCWRGGINVVDDNTIHRGARMVFLTLNFDTQVGRSQIVDNDHDKFGERFSRRCN